MPCQADLLLMRFFKTNLNPPRQPRQFGEPIEPRPFRPNGDPFLDPIGEARFGNAIPMQPQPPPPYWGQMEHHEEEPWQIREFQRQQEAFRHPAQFEQQQGMHGHLR